MDKRISGFITSQKLFTIAAINGNEPHCAICMYAYFPDEQMLVFSSKRSTRHVALALQNPEVAGTILPDKIETTALKGAQFTGTFLSPPEALADKIRRCYYLKYPFALAISGEVWVIKLHSVKMTDNSLGFGKKLIWNENTGNESKIA